MSFKKANALVREGNFREAEKIYEELYSKNSLEIYKSSLEFVRRKLNGSIIASEGSAGNGERNRIIFITAGLKGPTPGGGIATCFHSMIKTASESPKNKISILYMAHPYYATGDKESWAEYYKNECGADLIGIAPNKKNYGSQEMQRSYAALNFLRENEEVFDTIVFHDYGGLAYYTLLAQKYNLNFQRQRIIVSAHGNHSLSYHFGGKKINTWNEKAAIFMERASIGLAGEVTTPSDYYSRWLADNFNARNCIKLPNIILEGAAVGGELKIEFKDNSRQLLVFYGRLERLKGLDVFLSAIKELNKEKAVHNILFAGNSVRINGVDAKDYIQSELNGCKCEVRFRLNCQSDALYKYVNNNNGVCIFPTLGETSSCVVVECIQASVRFVAADIPGIKELISADQQDTYLFTAGSVSSLVERINALPPKPDKRTLSFNMEENKLSWNGFFSKNSRTPILVQKNSIAQSDLVTVIIPTADRPELLNDSIVSIKNQGYRNIEIIVVDDASLNNRANKLIAETHKVAYLYSPQKIYKGAACNLAARHAKGKYICFFDDDDIAKPTMIENYIKGFSADNSVDVFSGFADYFEHADFEETKKINVDYVSLALGGGLEVNMHINFFGKGTFIVKTERFNEIGGYEVDLDSVPMVDYRFYIKAALHGLNISIIPVAQYFYRKNSPNSLFYKNKDKRHLQYLAKSSIEHLLRKKLGFDIGKSVSSMVWHISLPNFE